VVQQQFSGEVLSARVSMGPWGTGPNASLNVARTTPERILFEDISMIFKKQVKVKVKASYNRPRRPRGRVGV